MSYGTGRIGEIITHLEHANNQAVPKIGPDVKLQCLCDCLQMPAGVFDRMIVENSPVFRPVKGHVFESFFDTLLLANGYEVEEVGGDTPVDRKIGHHTLQLKTCTEAGTTSDIIQYKTHNTHGAKSEKESMDYYHNIDHFADFLVGLVDYNPLKILVLRKSDLPTHPRSRKHILSPFTVPINGNPALNAFDRIGLKLTKLSVGKNNPGAEVLPLTSAKLGITSDIILNTILKRSNFRIWDMSIRGFAREVVFRNIVQHAGIRLFPPSDLRSDRADKADFAFKSERKAGFIQMKGISTNLCNFDAADPIISTETQLTRGRVNDHPTQSRLYKHTDFDFLVLSLDPPVVQTCKAKIGVSPALEWEFYLIPVHCLERHHVISNRIKSAQAFRYSALQEYKIRDWVKSFS